MAKVLRCSDVGFECDGVIRAETEEEVMQQAAEHAKTAHDVFSRFWWLILNQSSLSW